KWHPCSLADALDEAVETDRTDWPAALGKLFLHSRKGKNGCMEHIAIAMQDGGAGAGGRDGAAGRGPTPFWLARRPLGGSPVGGTFWFQIFIKAPSLEIWRKTISGAEGGSGEEVGWPVLSYLLRKKFSAE